jgi:hypothetical protein
MIKAISFRHMILALSLTAVGLQALATNRSASYVGYGPFVEAEFEGTPSARFVRSLINQKNLDASIREDKPLSEFLQFDPYLQPAFLKNSPAGYREILTQGLSLAFLFGEPSGVREGYSVGQHTVRVLETFDDQQELYQIHSIKVPYLNHDIQTFLRYTLAFHDIGKSIAFRGGDKGRETRYSDKLAYNLMRASGFTDAESTLALNLIDQHQVVGSCLQEKISLESATKQVRDRATYLRIKPAEYLRLLEIIFVADAGSYPFLRENAFNKVTVQNANHKSFEKLVSKDLDIYKLLSEAVSKSN